MKNGKTLSCLVGLGAILFATLSINPALASSPSIRDASSTHKISKVDRPLASKAHLLTPRSSYPVTVREVINRTVLSTSYTSPTAFADCAIGTTGGSCTITSGRAVNRTIGVDLGMSRAGVATSLGISASASVTTTVACSSGPMVAGQVWRAYGVGTRHRYQIRQTTFTGPITSRSTTSGLLYAFDPHPNRISCR